MGKVVLNLLDTRQDSDYGDFVELTKEDISALSKEVEEFRQIILKLIKE